MVSFKRPRLVNIALGLTAAAISSCLWASTVQAGDNERYWYADTLSLFAHNLSFLLVLAALGFWVLAGMTAFVKLLQRSHRRHRAVRQ